LAGYQQGEQEKDCRSHITLGWPMLQSGR
jgi:hypothetical protein